MNFLEIASGIASLVTALVAVFGTYSVLRQLKHSERSLRFNVCYQVLEMLEPTRQARHLLNEKLSQREHGAGLGILTDDERKQLDELAREFDKLGVIVRHNVVPLDFVLDFYKRPLLATWENLEPYIVAEREKRHQPGHMATFERLVIEAKKYYKTPVSSPSAIHQKWMIWRR